MSSRNVGRPMSAGRLSSNERIRGGNESSSRKALSPSDLQELIRKLGAQVPERLSQHVKARHLREMFSQSIPPKPPTLDDRFNAGFLEAFKIIGAGVDLAMNTKHLRTRSGSTGIQGGDPKKLYAQQLYEQVLAPLLAIMDNPEAADAVERLDAMEAALGQMSINDPVDAVSVRQPAFEQRFKDCLSDFRGLISQGSKEAHRQLIQAALGAEKGPTQETEKKQRRELVTLLNELVGIYQTGLTTIQQNL